MDCWMSARDPEARLFGTFVRFDQFGSEGLCLVGLWAEMLGAVSASLMCLVTLSATVRTKYNNIGNTTLSTMST